MLSILCNLKLRRPYLLSGSALVLSFFAFHTGRMVSAQNSETASGNLDIPKTTHIVGLEGVKPNISGDLTFNRSTMQFKAGDLQNDIPLRLIQAFSISHDDSALIGGAKGTVAGMAPYGVGQVISAIRPAADTLTLIYSDHNHALHGAILLLPKGKGDDVIATLARSGLTPRDYPKTGSFDPAQAEDKSHVKKEVGAEQGRPSIQVALLTENADGIPTSFPVGVYEDLVASLTKTGMFQRVWRQGDKRATSDSLVLHINIQELKKGSARARGLVPFTGPTVLKVEVRLTDADGKVLLQKDMDAAKRTRGENLDVTKNLTKKVTKELSKLPGLKAESTRDTMS